MTSTKKTLEPLEAIVFDIMVHLDPKLLKNPDQFIADPKKLREYRRLLTSVQYAPKKTIYDFLEIKPSAKLLASNQPL